MEAGQWWQLGGAALEFAGLMTVIVGIRETRGRYTNRAPLEQRAWRSSRRFIGRFRRRRGESVVVTAGAGMIGLSGGSVRATVSLGPWDDVDLGTRIERLRGQVERQQQEVMEVERRLDAEEKARAETDKRHDAERARLEQEMKDAVADAAAGSLRLEAIGVTLFVLGLAAGAIGVVLG